MNYCLRPTGAAGAAGPATPAPRARRITPRLLLVLAALAALPPIATDLYLPAFPLLAASLGATAAGVQLSLTTFLLGAALGQLLFGPLSDRRGRVGPLFAGTVACAAAGVAAALAPTIGALVVARFAQGFAGAAGLVVGRAIISDLAADPRDAARGFSLLMTVVGLAPIVAPWLGSLLVAPIGWRGILWVVVALTVAALLAAAASIRETHPASRRGAARAADAGFSALLSRRCLGASLTFAFAFAALMAYISASPFVFQNVLGLGVREYGFVFALVALALTATSVFSARLAAAVPPRRQILAGLSTVAAASAALVAVVRLRLPAAWTITAITIAVAGLGFVLGNATSAAVAAAPRAAGAASALLGALQFGFGAAVAPLVGLWGDRTAVPMAAAMTVAGLGALASFLVADGAERAARRGRCAEASAA